jgi:hypothetical protein
MSSSGLARQVRLVLEKQTDSLPLSELLFNVDQFVLECPSDQRELLLFQLEDDLQAIHKDAVDHTSLYQTQVFLAVLFHLGPVLTSTSIISIWFDLVLRPALREPRLPTPAVNHAKELVISALQRGDETHLEKVGEFRRRLLDLYLLDAYNEGSGDDVLEWAELNHPQRETITRWKSNLEDVLLKFGAERPQVSALWDLLGRLGYRWECRAGLTNRDTCTLPHAVLSNSAAHPSEFIYIIIIIPTICRSAGDTSSDVKLVVFPPS